MHDHVYNVPLIHTFIALEISGAIAFSFIILSACIFRGVKRPPVWFSFCISWVVICVSYSVLFVAGQQHKNPARGPCLTQAVLVHPAPLLVATTTFGLVFHLLLSTLSTLASVPNHEQKSHAIVTALLVCVPWVVWIIIIVSVLALSITHSNHLNLSHNGTYCVIKGPLVKPKVIGISVIIVSIAILCVEVTIGIVLYRKRAFMDVLGQSLTLAFRIFIFTLVGIGTLLCGFVFTMTSTRGIQFDIIFSAFPLTAALIFGTQKSLMKGWMFWTRIRQPIVPLARVPSETRIFPDSDEIQVRPTDRP